MIHKYELHSGQINFRNLDNTGSYSCIVIKDGVFYNLNDHLKELLLKAIGSIETTNLEDMF